MMIPLNEIKSESFIQLLSIFRNLDLELVIWGGACRDLLFSIYFPDKYSLDSIINDFDIAVIIDRNDINDNLYYKDFGEPYRILPAMMKECKKLCNFWNIDINDLCDEKNIQIAGLKFPVGLAGLRSVYDSNGNSFPDCFAMINRKTFNAVPICLSINSCGIDGKGNIYGLRENINDFKMQTARILRYPDDTIYSLPLLIRFIIYIHKYELLPEKETRKIINEYIYELILSDRKIKRSIRLNWMKKLLDKFNDTCKINNINDCWAVPLFRQLSELLSKIFEYYNQTDSNSCQE